MRARVIVALAACLCLTAPVGAQTVGGAMSSDERRAAIEAISADPSDEALARKARSEAILAQAGVTVNDALPVVQDSTQTDLRGQDAVVERLIAVAIAAVKGETQDHDLGLSLVDQFGAEAFLSPAERIFVLGDVYTSQERIDFIWHYEAVEVLLWAVGIYDQLSAPDMITDVPRLAGTLRDLGTNGLLANARLRTEEEILDQLDLVYRQHWAVVDARINSTPPPAGIDPSVIYERHYALNWLINYLGQSWDEITTDT